VDSSANWLPWHEDYSLGPSREKNEIEGRPVQRADNVPPADNTFEGQTERGVRQMRFLRDTLPTVITALAHNSWKCSVLRRRRGGNPPWPVVKRDIVQHLRRTRVIADDDVELLSGFQHPGWEAGRGGPMLPRSRRSR